MHRREGEVSKYHTKSNPRLNEGLRRMREEKGRSKEKGNETYRGSNAVIRPAGAPKLNDNFFYVINIDNEIVAAFSSHVDARVWFKTERRVVAIIHKYKIYSYYPGFRNLDLSHIKLLKPRNEIEEAFSNYFAEVYKTEPEEQSDN